MKVSRVKLGDLCHVVTKGTTPTSVGFDFSDDGIPFLRIQNLNNRSVEFDDVLYISEQTHKALSRSIIRPKDFLITIAGTIGKVAIVPDHFPECNCNQAIAILRFDYKKLNPHYLLHWLATSDALEQITGRKVTATISNLSLGQIKQLEIPLPPLAEQQKIAAILDAADSLRQKDQQLVERYTALSQSLFLEMFGDPVTNPMGWPESRLADLTTFENGDRSSNYPSGNDIKDSGVLFLSTKNITESKLDLKAVQFISEQKFKSLTRGKAVKGDLLITLRGSLGNCCIFDSEYNTAFINAQMMIIRTRNQLSNLYLHSLITNIQFNSMLQVIGRGAAVQQLTANQLGQLCIMMPPYQMQTLFAERIQLIEGQKQQAQRSLEKSKALFNSLLQRAFTSELTAKMVA